jgi:hypothetical protein
VNGSAYPPRVGPDGAGEGWCLDAPVKGSPPPVCGDAEVFVVGWYRDAPVKGSPPAFELGTLLVGGWYRDPPSQTGIMSGNTSKYIHK